MCSRWNKTRIKFKFHTLQHSIAYINDISQHHLDMKCWMNERTAKWMKNDWMNEPIWISNAVELPSRAQCKIYWQPDTSIAYFLLLFLSQMYKCSYIYITNKVYESVLIRVYTNTSEQMEIWKWNSDKFHIGRSNQTVRWTSQPAVRFTFMRNYYDYCHFNMLCFVCVRVCNLCIVSIDCDEAKHNKRRRWKQKWWVKKRDRTRNFFIRVKNVFIT